MNERLGFAPDAASDLGVVCFLSNGDVPNDGRDLFGNRSDCVRENPRSVEDDDSRDVTLGVFERELK